jgi:hypothetical protein
MTATEIVIAIGIFLMGAGLGLVLVVNIGIRHEELLSRNRLDREEQGIGPGSDGPHQFFSAAPPDLVGHGARALTGLWIRREEGTDPFAIPRYERRY